MSNIFPGWAERELDRTGAELDRINAIADRLLMQTYDAAVELGADWDDTEYLLAGLDDAMYGNLIPHLEREAQADADTRQSLMLIASPHYLGSASV